MDKRTRHLDAQLKSHFAKYRQVLILLGPRQVGKTTLLQRLFPDAQYFLLDNDPVRKNFETYDVNFYKQFIHSKSKQIVIDEVQLLGNPGKAAKIIYDQMPDIQLILTGSSALNIKNKTSESLAGRKVEYHLYPLTFSEYLYQIGVLQNIDSTFFERILTGDLQENAHLFDLKATLSHVLTYGLSPYLVDHPSDETYLKELSRSSIYRDIFELNLIENRAVASDL